MYQNRSLLLIPDTLHSAVLTDDARGRHTPIKLCGHKDGHGSNHFLYNDV